MWRRRVSGRLFLLTIRAVVDFGVKLHRHCGFHDPRPTQFVLELPYERSHGVGTLEIGRHAQQLSTEIDSPRPFAVATHFDGQVLQQSECSQAVEIGITATPIAKPVPLIRSVCYFEEFHPLQFSSRTALSCSLPEDFTGAAAQLRRCATCDRRATFLRIMRQIVGQTGVSNACGFNLSPD